MVWLDDGSMLAIEHGPSFLPHEDGRYGHDELNVIVRGGNYGWPVEAGDVPDAQFRTPLIDWESAIAPAGMAVYSDSLFTDWTGSILVGGLRGMQLRRIELSGRGEAMDVVSDDVILTGYGRIRAVHVGPDGAVYHDEQSGRTR
jgi:glucose/arabinose dehydrogenase